MPKIATEIQIPPLVAAGTYKIVVKVEDMVAKTIGRTRACRSMVRSKTVEPSDTLTVRNFEFFRGEDDTAAAAEGRLPGRAMRCGPSSTSSASSTARRIIST